MSPKLERCAVLWIAFILLIAHESKGYATDRPASRFIDKAQFRDSEVIRDIGIRSKFNREAYNYGDTNLNTEARNEAPSNPQRTIGPMNGVKNYWDENSGGKIFGDELIGDDNRRMITTTKEVGKGKLFPIERSIHYPVPKKILYPVKIPFPQRYAVEKEIPYPVKVYVRVPMKIPKPVPVIKEIPYPVGVPLERPVPFNVYIPRPYPVEKIVHYEVQVPIPEPFPIEKKIPVPVRVAEHVARPYPVEEELLYPLEIEADEPVTVRDPETYPVPIDESVSHSVEEETAAPIVEYPKNRRPWLREEENYRANDELRSNEDWDIPEKIDR